MKVAYIIVSRKENSVSRGQLVVREEFQVPNTALYSSSVTQKVLRWYEIAHMPKKIEVCKADFWQSGKDVQKKCCNG
jgi:hypothetical protein